MVRLMKTPAWMVVAVLTAVFVTSAQTQPQREDLAIQGYSGRATVVRFQGRSLVDVRDLAGSQVDRSVSREIESF